MQLTGQLITLDRSLPLVRIDDLDLRAEYAVSFSRDELKATVGDWLDLEQAHPQALPQIIAIRPRRTVLARRVCREHPSIGSGLVEEQMLAANFDRVCVVTDISRPYLDLDYLERQLVAACESQAAVTLVLNKVDLLTEPLSEQLVAVSQLAPDTTVLACSALDKQGIKALQELCPSGSMTVFFGRSGVGKSSLINALIGRDDLLTAATRQRDQAGRHTTVARRMVFADGRAYFDTPGVRSIGNYQHQTGLSAVFADIVELAEHCRFRDCKHLSEPGCAVQDSISAGSLSERRLNSYLSLAAEVAGDDVLV